jgi:ABC-type transport system involved in Fe-S cluster assembly fused permease/ATPase subunit
MVILVADHPVIVAAEFKISLPKTVTVLSLETLGSQCLSRLSYRVVQASFAVHMISLVMVDG